MEERLYSVWLSRVCGAGSRIAVRLLRTFGTATAVHAATEAQIRGELPREADRILSLLADRRTDKDAEVLAFCDAKGVRVLTPGDPLYPKSLLELQDYPVVLFAVGQLPDFNHTLCCSVVGTRKMTAYGQETAYQLGYGLAAGGAVVVSGMALGSDSMAMAGALEAGGQTVGVLGSGIDVVYPPEHRQLMRSIIGSGAVLTEYLPGTPPAGANFPKRNRIISGLSVATVVVEADARSGALITARDALYQGRALFAVPGRIDEVNAEGVNLLIKEGARAVSEASEVLREFEFLYPHIVRIRTARSAVRQKHTTSEEAAARLQISYRGKEQPLYGQGVYGGRTPEELPESPRASAPPATPATRRAKPALAPEKRAERKKTDKKVTAAAAAVAAPPASRKADEGQSAHMDFDMLGEAERRLYALLPPDMPILPDEMFHRGGGELSLSQILSSLTLLEITGMVEAGAGGYYLRRSGDGFDLPETEKEE